MGEEDDFPFDLPYEILQMLGPFEADTAGKPPTPLDIAGTGETITPADFPLIEPGPEGDVHLGGTGLGFSGSGGVGIQSSFGHGVVGAVADIPPVWIRIEQGLDCSGCLLLRQVLHGDEDATMKLLIHGGMGTFHHAIVELVNVRQGCAEEYIADLSGRSAEAVKRFLADYGRERLAEGLLPIWNTVDEFYDTLCVGMDGESSAGDGYAIDILENLCPDEGLCQPRPSEREEAPAAPQIGKTRIAAQRERTAGLKLEDIAEYFHLPISAASKQLNLCTTALKRVCRRHGVPRWPYRKVKSLDSMISKVGRSLSSQTNAAELKKLLHERERVCKVQRGKT